MPAITFNQLALEEYLSARKRYRIHAHETGERFRRAIDEAISRIAAAPNLCAHAAANPHVRWIKVKRFPYLLFFAQHSDGTLRILAVAHASRRAGYWRRRT